MAANGNRQPLPTTTTTLVRRRNKNQDRNQESPAPSPGASDRSEKEDKDATNVASLQRKSMTPAVTSGRWSEAAASTPSGSNDAAAGPGRNLQSTVVGSGLVDETGPSKGKGH